MHKRVVVSGYYGFNNFGDEAILGVLAKKLRELEMSVTVLSSNPSSTSMEYKVDSVKSFDFFKVLNTIKNSDILISGGGSLLQDVTSIKSLLYYLWVINTAHRYKKDVVIFAQGIGPVNNPICRFLVKKALKKCKLVTVRDEKSLFLLRGWGIKTELVCDPLFDLKLVGTMPSNRVGIQVREFKTLKENLLIKLAEQVNKDFSDKLIEIYSFQDALDLEVCKRFETILKNLNPNINTKVVSGKTSTEILDCLSKLDYMIGMRFHACLIALKYGIKTFAICYDEKVEKLAIEAKIPAVGMLADEDYDYLFKNLKNLNRRELLEFSNSKHFSWEPFEKVICEQET